MRYHESNIRRGNTLVLAVGILVLLAIIATSYVATTHSSRITATSQQYAAMRGEGVKFFANSIAGEIAGALFVRPVDFLNDAQIIAGWVGDSSFPRLPTPADAARYMPDSGDYRNNTTGQQNAADGLLDFMYNTPPYQVVPWTNWPDPDPFNADPWPINEDNPSSLPLLGGVNLFSLVGVGEGNPPGGPGFNDTRWLADTEPVRLAIRPGLDGLMGSADDVAVFTHWRHMSNVARPNNGWRVCRDIADVFLDWDGDPNAIREAPNVVTDLSIPHEQWLSAVPQPAQLNFATGNMVFNVNSFWTPWRNWLRLPNDPPGPRYAGVYPIPAQTPLNLYNLRDLDGDGILHEPGERPLDEFIPNTPRWNVCRVLADTDGDGFTDAMWFLAPAGIDRSIRQIVAVRIVDNSAMLNVNLATRFGPSNQNNLVDTLSYRTKGLTPVDLALVGSLEGFDLPLNLPDWPGFLDNPDHWFAAPIIAVPGAPQFNALYDDDNPGNNTVDPEKLWERHLREMGLLFWTSTRSDLVTPNQGEELFLDEGVRHDYWLGVGQAMLASDSQHPLPNCNYTPYGIADELELRMLHGNNSPGIYSRLERVTQPSSQDSDNGILHGGAGQNTAGSSEFLGKLGNADLVRDSRRKLTTYSGARNDVMPPWLWPGRTLRYWNFDNNAFLDVDERRQFEADVRKYDLRRSFFLPDNTRDDDIDADGEIEQPGGAFAAEVDDDINNDGFVTINDHHARLQRHLEGVLLDVLVPGPTIQPQRMESYFGTGVWGDLKKTTRAAASLAANILAYRDRDSLPLTLDDAVVWTDPQNGITKYAYVGMETQPFLVEAFIAHVHEGLSMGVGHPIVIGGNCDSSMMNLGDNIICANSAESTIVAVQIANPFDRPVDLTRFRIMVFGQELSALGGFLNPGQARTYYALAGDAVDSDKWKDALGLNPDPAYPKFEFIDVTGLGVWSTERDGYDGSEKEAVEIIEMIDRTGGPVPVVVDRIDIEGVDGSVAPTPTFAAKLTGFCNYDGPCVPPPDPLDWEDVRSIDSDTHLVQWVRAARMWEVDVDDDGFFSAGERSPRYVFAYRDLEFPEKPFSYDGPTWLGNVASFNTARKINVSALLQDKLDFPLQMLQKDDDFEQVGELYNVWLFGHELNLGTVSVYQDTKNTFSEFMWDEIENAGLTSAERDRVNRLRIVPAGAINPILGEPQVNWGDPQYDTLYVLDPAHGTPKLTAGARALEAFVCDGPGTLPWPANSDGIDVELRSLRMAGGFSGRGTPGLINLQTATPEVLQSIPGWSRLIHEGATSDPTNPYVHMAQAVVRYRDRLGDPTVARDPVTGLYDTLPSYADRGIKPPPPYTSQGFYPGLRQSRGFAAIGELMFLLRSGKWGKDDSDAGVKYDQSQNPLLPHILYNSSFRADYPMVPERDVYEAELGSVPAGAYLFPVMPANTGASARVSTDVVHGFDPGPTPLPDDDFNVADDTAADVEEGNLLVAGASNLVTTRSDVFTVYFKVRSFRQNPVTGRWDATDPEMIVDDSRYVMLVDRTEVNKPSDKPRIVYLEKLPQ